jgi:signal transduction histidine kinase
LSVEDEGPGITEAERERVLERFYRIAGTPGSGWGLALAIGQEIARAHGATLEITQPKAGKFTCILAISLGLAARGQSPISCRELLKNGWNRAPVSANQCSRERGN